MADDENRKQWEYFLEIGRTIHKLRGKDRKSRLAKLALLTSDELVENRFITRLSVDEKRMYVALIDKFQSYLDGDDAVIQEAVKLHFLILHLQAGLDQQRFHVSFQPKVNGIQSGLICRINDGIRETRYFIKTHQHGPTESSPTQTKPPDIKELFIYKFINSIGLGPDVHFIFPSVSGATTIYIATKDCHLVLLAKLTEESADYKALVQLDLISRILCLRDCATNSSNCGQVNKKPIIIDFRIENQLGGYAKKDIVDKFYEGNGEFAYAGLMAQAVGISKEEKLCILKESLQEWNLLEHLDETESKINDWLHGTRAIEFIAHDDFKQYVEDVRSTIQFLSLV